MEEVELDEVLAHVSPGEARWVREELDYHATLQITCGQHVRVVDGLTKRLWSGVTGTLRPRQLSRNVRRRRDRQ